MTKESRTVNILYIQLVQSKFLALFVVTFVISLLIRMNFTWSLISNYLFYGSGYFIILLFTMALQNAVHERGHISKLKEYGYEATNFKANRIGDVSFRNIETLSAEEGFQVAASPFLAPISYIIEIISFLILVGINIISPFPLDLLLFLFTSLASISLIGSFCATYVVRKRKTSGLCVRLARTITSRGDIDEIIAWNEMGRRTS
jgi:hypothetical protein